MLEHIIRGSGVYQSDSVLLTCRISFNLTLNFPYTSNFHQLTLATFIYLLYTYLHFGSSLPASPWVPERPYRRVTRSREELWMTWSGHLEVASQALSQNNTPSHHSVPQPMVLKLPKPLLNPLKHQPLSVGYTHRSLATMKTNRLPHLHHPHPNLPLPQLSQHSQQVSHLLTCPDLDDFLDPCLLRCSVRHTLRTQKQTNGFYTANGRRWRKRINPWRIRG
jgi:hypothetical protein